MGGDAGSHGSPDPGGWRGRQLPESQREARPRLRAKDHSGAPSSPEGRILQPSSGPRGAAGLQASGNPRPGRGAGTKPGPARASRLRELGSAHLSGSPDVSPRRLAALPPRGRPTPQTARARTLFLTSAESP